MVYIYHIFFIHSSVDGHMGCFNILAIVNSAVINIKVDLEGIMLSEINPTEKTNTALYHLYVQSKKAKLLEIEVGMVVTRGWGMGELGRC